MNLSELRKQAGQYVFNRWITPPEFETERLKRFEGDYGHGFYYEELFSGDGSDLRFAVRECLSFPGAVMDLGGGAGRLAIELSCRGISTTLVDHSETMLERARIRRSLLSRSARRNLLIHPQDIRNLHLDQRFQHIFSFNNVLEHFSSDEDILKTLRAIYHHLEPHGRFYTDVHFNLYLEKDPTWKSGEWRYIQDQTVENHRYRIWSRTFKTELPSDVVCDHAISEDLLGYTLLRTNLRVYPAEIWKQFFEIAGFKIASLWGSWEKTPVSPMTPKLVFVLEK